MLFSRKKTFYKFFKKVFVIRILTKTILRQKNFFLVNTQTYQSLFWSD